MVDFEFYTGMCGAPARPLAFLYKVLYCIGKYKWRGCKKTKKGNIFYNSNKKNPCLKYKKLKFDRCER